MSTFVDTALLRFADDTFVGDLLTEVGLAALFAASYTARDFGVESVALASVGPRSYKVPAFETLRSTGAEERVVPDTQRVRVDRVYPRFGRIDWIDVAFDAVLATQVSMQVAPLQSITSQSLEQRLGGVASIAELRAKLLALYTPGVVDDLLLRMRVTTIEDFRADNPLFVQMIGAAPPPFVAGDPANLRSFAVPMRVKVAEGFDAAAALQAAKFGLAIAESNALPDDLPGVDRNAPCVFLTLFNDAAVTDASLPGFTADEAKAAVRALFASESMFAHFIT